MCQSETLLRVDKLSLLDLRSTRFCWCRVGSWIGMCLTITLQTALSIPRGMRSSKFVCEGTSTSKLPCLLCNDCAARAVYVMWPGPCHNMWTTHRSLRCLILWIRFRLHVVASSAGILLSVNLDSMWLFTPLMSARVCLSRVHVSQPNISKEQTEVS